MQEQGGGGDVVGMMDQGFSKMSEDLAQAPGAEQYAQKMDQIHQAWRALVEEIMQAMGGQGGGGQQGSSPDRSQGTPQSPGGAY